MWIVKLSKHKRHSAWLTVGEALNQVRVLRDAGLLKRRGSPSRFIEFDVTVQCENGHYYV